MLHLEPLQRSNWEDCANLKIADQQQEKFLPSALHCIAELQFWPNSKGFVIRNSDQIVGLVVFGLDESKNWKIFRFLIDKSHQRKGYGRAAMHLVLLEISASNSNAEIRLCYHPKNIAAKKLYASFGFKEVELQQCSRSPEGKILAIKSKE